ncbi:hypothetical protein F5887DRAFT_1198792 [Amanita rubescens]|nr:hypothetical protein F5887DRAFT_1198792 [Amanita rubescens]
MASWTPSSIVPPLLPLPYPEPAPATTDDHHHQTRSGTLNLQGLRHVIALIFRFIYIALLLFLPFSYRRRVQYVFVGANLIVHEISSHYVGGPPVGAIKPRRWEEIEYAWSDFIDSMLKEWNSLNIVSVLLLTAIYNVLQLGGVTSPLVQCTALMSFISALMSLIFGCLCAIRLETMRRSHKAMREAREALFAVTGTCWNVFVLLSLPLLWLSWSLILFVICLMAVIWKASGNTTSPLHGLLPIIKIIISVFLFIGVLCLSLILSTFSHYEDSMDKAWGDRLQIALENTQYTRAFIDASVVHLRPPLVPPSPQDPISRFRRRRSTHSLRHPSPADFSPLYTSATFLPPLPLHPTLTPLQDPISRFRRHSADSLNLSPLYTAAFLPYPRLQDHISPNTTPFIPALPPLSADDFNIRHTTTTTSRFLSPYHTPPSPPPSSPPHLFSIAEGEGEEPSSLYSHERPSWYAESIEYIPSGEDPQPPLQQQQGPQQTHSEHPNSSADSAPELTMTAAPGVGEGVRRVPTQFPPDVPSPPPFLLSYVTLPPPFPVTSTSISTVEPPPPSNGGGGGGGGDAYEHEYGFGFGYEPESNNFEGTIIAGGTLGPAPPAYTVDPRSGVEFGIASGDGGRRSGRSSRRLTSSPSPDLDRERERERGGDGDRDRERERGNRRSERPRPPELPLQQSLLLEGIRVTVPLPVTLESGSPGAILTTAMNTSTATLFSALPISPDNQPQASQALIANLPRPPSVGGVESTVASPDPPESYHDRGRPVGLREMGRRILLGLGWNNRREETDRDRVLDLEGDAV